MPPPIRRHHLCDKIPHRISVNRPLRCAKMALVLFAVGEIRILPDDQCQIGIAARIFQKYATDNKLTLKY